MSAKETVSFISEVSLLDGNTDNHLVHVRTYHESIIGKIDFDLIERLVDIKNKKGKPGYVEVDVHGDGAGNYSIHMKATVRI